MNESDFKGLNSPEQREWKQHREVLHGIPSHAAGWRGYVGLALVVDSSNADSWVQAASKLFIPDSQCRWASIVDVPVGRWSGVNNREVHWASVRRSHIAFGMPSLGREERGWDFRTIPRDGDSSKDILSPAHHAQLFRTFNRIEWAMTSSAFVYRAAWQESRTAFNASRGCTQPGKPILLFGGGETSEFEEPVHWMPRPYLAFEVELAEMLYDLVTRPQGQGGADPAYPDSLITAFVMSLNTPHEARYDGTCVSVKHETYCDAPCIAVELAAEAGGTETLRFNKKAKISLVEGQGFKAGDIVGEEGYQLPKKWDYLSVEERWVALEKYIRIDQRDARIRSWFERQFYYLQEGVVHVPAALSAPAAIGNVDDSKLVWNVSPSGPYYNQSADAFIFPPVRIAKLEALDGILPGGVAYNFSPNDPRWIGGKDRWGGRPRDNERGRGGRRRRGPREEFVAPSRTELDDLGGLKPEEVVEEENTQEETAVDILNNPSVYTDPEPIAAPDQDTQEPLQEPVQEPAAAVATIVEPVVERHTTRFKRFNAKKGTITFRSDGAEPVTMNYDASLVVMGPRGAVLSKGLADHRFKSGVPVVLTITQTMVKTVQLS